jgi:hypothetical protein
MLLRAPHRFTDAGGILGVVFVALDVWLHKLRADEPDRMAQLRQLPSPVVGTAGGFQADEAWGQSGEKGQDLVPREPFFENDLAVDVHTVELKKVFGRINTQRSNLLHGGPSYD